MSCHEALFIGAKLKGNKGHRNFKHHLCLSVAGPMPWQTEWFSSHQNYILPALKHLWFSV